MGLHLSPTNLAAHASARSQTSKNVKHVDALSGGRGRDGYRRPLGRASSAAAAALHPEPPPPSSGVEAGRGPSARRPPRPSPGLRGELQRTGRQLDWEGEPLAGGPADFLLILQETGPLCACERLWAAGGLRSALRLLPQGRTRRGQGGAARQRGREGTPGFLAGASPPARRWNFEPEKAWCFSCAALLREEERFMCWGLWGGGQVVAVVTAPGAEFRLTFAEGRSDPPECPLFL